MDKIGIIGVGTFGEALIKNLIRIHSDVEIIAVDVDAEALKKVSTLTTKTIKISSLDYLEQTGLGEVNVVVICIGKTIDNILATYKVVKLREKTKEIKKIIARAYSEDHKEILLKLGADEVIMLEQESAINLAKRILFSDIISTTMHTIFSGEEYLEIGSFTVTSWHDILVGKSLKEIDLRSKYGINVIAMKKNIKNKRKLIVPTGNEKIEVGDEIFIIGEREKIANFLELLKRR